MACSSCGNKNKQKQPDMARIAQPNLTPSGPMKDYIISQGWIYIGLCGCKTNKEMYINPLYPNVQIWMTKTGDIMQLRMKYDGPDTVVRAVAGKDNYMSVYSWWITQNHIRHKNT